LQAVSSQDKEIVLSNKTNEFQAVYPEPFLTKQHVKYGGFLIYLGGIMYAFVGISLVT